MLTILVIQIQSVGQRPSIFTSAKYTLTELEKNVIQSLIDNDIDALINNKSSMLNLSKLGISHSISAKDLAVAYEKNEVAADNLYKGNIVEVRGNVSEISKNVWGQGILRLSAHKKIANVYAHMTRSEIPYLAGISKGDFVSVTCRGDGVVIGSPILRGCRNSHAYMEDGAIKRINKFFRGRAPDDKTAIIIASYGLYLASKITKESICYTEASSNCFKEVDSLFKTIPSAGAQNSDYMEIISGLNKAGVMSNKSVSDLNGSLK